MTATQQLVALRLLGVCANVLVSPAFEQRLAGLLGDVDGAALLWENFAGRGGYRVFDVPVKLRELGSPLQWVFLAAVELWRRVLPGPVGF
eukprot:55508-Rhodomonas_salina.1